MKLHADHDDDEPFNKRLWFIVRLLFLAGAFLGGCLNKLPDSFNAAPFDHITLTILLIVFLGVVGFGIVLTIFVVTLHDVVIDGILLPKIQWRYPSWSINPFLYGEPLQFYHLAGFCFLSFGAGSALRNFLAGQGLSVVHIFFPAVGAGILGGAYACTFVYRKKMAGP